VLVLSNNALHTLRGAWFHNTRGLIWLQLDGNQITNLTDSSFGSTDLHSLRHLDLSNNFISYIEKDVFRPLPQLQEVDLSWNKLGHMPDVFTPLKQLSFLSLEKNQWSCACDLHSLAHFLRNYIKSSAHMLRNAKDLNCQLSTPAMATVKSMLRLSETNCDSKAPNLTLVLKDGHPPLPGQDVALITVLGFAGMPRRKVPASFPFSCPYFQSVLNDALVGNWGDFLRLWKGEIASLCGKVLAELAQDIRISFFQKSHLTQKTRPWNSRTGISSIIIMSKVPLDFSFPFCNAGIISMYISSVIYQRVLEHLLCYMETAYKSDETLTFSSSHSHICAFLWCSSSEKALQGHEKI
jgi:hypothetical protein